MPDRPPLDPYHVMDLPRDASDLQVARAYRRLAKRFHPDLNPDGHGTDRMRAVNEAWEILSSPDRRASYDVTHPAIAGPSTGHWAASRTPIRPAQPTNTRTWATWRATAAETRAAPRTVRQPGEVPIPATRRPQPISPAEPTFRDSGWAAAAVAAVFLVMIALAVVAGKLI
jgi:curved DNA-binding protein CbpA